MTSRERSVEILLSLAKGERRALLWATVSLLVAASINLSYPKLIGMIVDAISLGTSEESSASALTQAHADLNRWVLILIGLFCVMGIATFVRSYLFTLAGERVVFHLRRTVFERLLEQEQALFDTTHSGQWLSRLADDCSKIQRAVTVNLSMLLRYLISTVGALGILSWISWELTLIMVTVVPLTVAGAALYGRALRRLSKKVQDDLARSSEIAQEAIAGIRTVQTFNGAPLEVRRYSATLDLAFSRAQRRAWLGAIFQGGISLASYIAIAVVIWYGGGLTLSRALSLGDLTAFMLYTFTLAFSVGALSGLWEDFSKALGSTEVIFEILSRIPLVQGGPLRPRTCEGRVEFEGVTFAYPARLEIDVLRDLTLTLHPKEVVALVGVSGGGKSTVAALIQRFYDPREGRITLDGAMLSTLDLIWLRAQVGVVAQEPILFATSLEENIRYGRPEATLEEIEEAARVANAHAFIDALPKGYQTQVGERGMRLSGGQKQRVAIARALLKNPQILILDEATSALDAESERAVQEALTRLMVGRTTLLIAHRLSTVRQADRLVVIEGGTLVEEGSPEVLLAQGGRYADLVRRQLTADEPPSDR